MEREIAQAAQAISLARHVTVFTGAGISVESGIPPFRGPGGLWNKYDPKVLDLSYFHAQPAQAWAVIKELFYDFFGAAKPNAAHLAVSQLEKMGKVKAVITQNIDNLHQEAGSSTVYEFHGSMSTMVCTKTGKVYDAATIDLNTLPPLSESGGLLKPNFIFFGEGIPGEAYDKSMAEADLADVFLVIGTTGEIMPAAGIPYTAKRKGATIIEINPERSAYTGSLTDIYIKAKAGEAMLSLLEQLGALKN